MFRVWNWLVPFRVVAEAGSLSAASKQMSVASSALSRSIKLLENGVGATLFIRMPRGMKLTHAGERLLSSLQNTMELVDGVIAHPNFRSAPQTLDAHVNVGVPASLLPFVARIRHSGNVLADPPVVLHTIEPSQALKALTRRSIDVALVPRDTDKVGLDCRVLRPIERSIFVANTQLLESRRPLRFAVPTTPLGEPTDHFPQDVSRIVGVWLSDPTAVYEAVRAGDYAAVLPTPSGEAAGFHAVRSKVELPPVHYSLARRQRIPESPHVQRVADNLARVFAMLNVAPSQFASGD